MSYRHHKKTLVIIVIVALVLTAVFYWMKLGRGGAMSFSPSITPDASLETYTNETYQFSMKYPSTLKVSTFRTPDDASDVVLISEKDTAIGMQILVSPFDEDLNILTVDRIKKDAPQLTILSPQDVTMGSAGRGVAFLDGANSSANRQVWFVANRHLYQITAPVAFDKAMQSILNTWVFQ